MKASVKSLKINNVRINVAGCLDNCENGPTVVIYPEGTWYKVRKKLDVEEIISEHLMKGNKVQRLLIEKEK